jgi:hypothetical protein
MFIYTYICIQYSLVSELLDDVHRLTGVYIIHIHNILH